MLIYFNRGLTVGEALALALVASGLLWGLLVLGAAGILRTLS